jgi:hypothetical protein
MLPGQNQGVVVLPSGEDPREEGRMDRDWLLDDLRWLADGNPAYAGADEEGRQNAELAHLMADDLLLGYIDDREVTVLFERIRRR